MRRIFPSQLALVAITLVACRSKDAPRVAIAPSAPPSAPSLPAPVDTSTLVIPASPGVPRTSIKIGDAIAIVLGSGSDANAFKGVTHGKGKSRYTGQGGAKAFQVDPGPKGFKLEDSTGKLLWKVKFEPGESKIKVSDNEQNDRPVVLTTDAGLVQVKDQDAKLGEVAAKQGSSGSVVSDAANKPVVVVANRVPSAAFGLCLVRRIPAEQRAVIQAELLARGR